MYFGEKLLTLTVAESPAVQKAVEEASRVLQTGSQQAAPISGACSAWRLELVSGAGRLGKHQEHRVPPQRQPNERIAPGNARPRGAWIGISGPALPPKVPYRKNGQPVELPLRIPLVVRLLPRAAR